MSVDLLCAACGARMGYADSSDNYKEKFLMANKKGEPICPNCKSGDYPWWTPFAAIGMLLSVLFFVEGIVYGVGSLINGHWLNWL